MRARILIAVAVAVFFVPSVIHAQDLARGLRTTAQSIITNDDLKLGSPAAAGIDKCDFNLCILGSTYMHVECRGDDFAILMNDQGGRAYAYLRNGMVVTASSDGGFNIYRHARVELAPDGAPTRYRLTVDGKDTPSRVLVDLGSILDIDDGKAWFAPLYTTPIGLLAADIVCADGSKFSFMLKDDPRSRFPLKYVQAFGRLTATLSVTRIQVNVDPAMSFLDLTEARLAQIHVPLHEFDIAAFDQALLKQPPGLRSSDVGQRFAALFADTRPSDTEQAN